MIRVLLDTNILISAAINRGKPFQIICQANQQFELLTSQYILAEVTDVLSRKHIRAKYPRYASAAERRLLVHHLRDVAIMVRSNAKTSTRLRGAVPHDPEDEPVLACAVDGKANYLVSGDPHLLDVKIYNGIRIMSPADFLQILEPGRRQ